MAKRVEEDLIACVPRGHRSHVSPWCYFRYLERGPNYHSHIPIWRGPRMAIGETIYTSIYWEMTQ